METIPIEENQPQRILLIHPPLPLQAEMQMLLWAEENKLILAIAIVAMASCSEVELAAVSRAATCQSKAADHLMRLVVWKVVLVIASDPWALRQSLRRRAF